MANDDLRLLRQWRTRNEYSLQDVSDLLEEYGHSRQSLSSLSRFEREGVPVKLLQVFSEITGISARELRPDLAKLFEGRKR